ncbi:MAG: phosphoenolpyruvate--protein phosphotransferase [Candidatus Omnitrophica bacterium]|nr:phosphoenolpyruvate--protein phosphotransferase [Candidatus Omnitrophota bacterium]
MDKTKTLKGISAQPGIVKGKIYLCSPESKNIASAYPISKDQVETELNRLIAALKKTRQEIQKTLDTAKDIFESKTIDIIKSHLAIVNDPNLLDEIKNIIDSKLVNAEHAVNEIFTKHINNFKDQKGHFKELVHDFIDSRDRILESFGTVKRLPVCAPLAHEAAVIAIHKLTPSLVLSIPKENVLAFVTKEGSYTSHAIILARSYRVPILFGINVEEELKNGQTVIVDASHGKIVINPDKKTELYYDNKIKNIQKKKLVCEAKKAVVPQTTTGKKITLKINISVPEEYELVKDLAHDGIGLLRTEFLFTNRRTPPTEEEQFELYNRFFESIPDKPVTVRLLDISPDKRPVFMESPDIINSYNLRGALAVEMFPAIYKTQVKALLRANTAHNLRILYPMVSDLNDLRIFRNILTEAKQELKDKGMKFHVRNLQEGVMIETPSAVFAVKDFLQEVDFANIGSNDLLQYTIASFREDTISALHYHIMHPSLVKMMEFVVKEARSTGKEICLCGEISSFEEYYPVLLAIGIESFSVTASKFDDIKCELLHIAEKEHAALLGNFYKLSSREEIEKFFAEFV